VRPVILTNGPKTNAYRALVDPRGWTCGFISRGVAAENAVSSMTAAPSRARELLFPCESAAHQLETAGLEISIGG
jgi:hypothetical protein